MVRLRQESDEDNIAVWDAVTVDLFAESQREIEEARCVSVGLQVLSFF